jgi:hypothetical protein
LDATPLAPEQPPSPLPAATEDEPASEVDGATHAEPAEWDGAPVPQPPSGDPLAALKAMSDDELIAVFS